MNLANPVISAAESLAPDGHRGKRIISSLLCGQTSNQVISATAAASYLMGGDDHLLTHETQPIDPAIAAIVARRILSHRQDTLNINLSGAFDNQQQVILVKITPNINLDPASSSSATVVNTKHQEEESFVPHNTDEIDFHYRSEFFDQLGYVLYTMCFYRRKLPNESHAPKTFHDRYAIET